MLLVYSTDSIKTPVSPISLKVDKRCSRFRLIFEQIGQNVVNFVIWKTVRLSSPKLWLSIIQALAVHRIHAARYTLDIRITRNARGKRLAKFALARTTLTLNLHLRTRVFTSSSASSKTEFNVSLFLSFILPRGQQNSLFFIRYYSLLSCAVPLVAQLKVMKESPGFWILCH